MEFHPVANLFPMMSGDEFEALAADIRENGLREEIWTHEGKIIDGRNRHLACQQAGISPTYRAWNGRGSLVAFVVSLNLKRRHLSSSQKAMVAVNMLPMLEEEARERQRQAAVRRHEQIKHLEQVVNDSEASEGKKLTAQAAVLQLKGQPKDEARRDATQVYFAESAGRVKIGASLDPESRLKTIRTSNPDVSLLAVVPGGFELETELHRKHASARIDGEWYELTPELREEIEDFRALGKNAQSTEAFHARREAAKVVGAGERYISDAKRIAEKAPELVQPVLAGEIKIPEARRIAELPPEQRAEAIQKPHVAHNNGDNEWYTPQEYIEAATTVLGRIDLDPASSADANAVVKAKQIYTAEDDGLSKEWCGKVWMNPPYAQPLIWQFCDKLASNMLQCNVSEAIVLVNNGTETAWFHRLAEVSTAICFPKGRIKFWAPNKTATPLQGQAVFYMGSRSDEFAAEFGRFGIVVRL